jgi:hypothetical protein
MASTAQKLRLSSANNNLVFCHYSLHFSHLTAMPTISVGCRPDVVYTYTNHYAADLIAILVESHPSIAIHEGKCAPILLDELIHTISEDTRLTRLNIVIHDAPHASWQVVATIVANLRYITTARIMSSYSALDHSAVRIPPLSTPSRIRVMYFTSDCPEFFPIICDLGKFVTHLATPVDSFLPHPDPSFLPSVTHLRITSYFDVTGDTTYPRRLQSLIDYFPHLTYLDVRSVPSAPASVVRIPIRQPPIVVHERSTNDIIAPIPFRPLMSDLRRPLCQSTGHPFGAVIASFFLAVDRITAIDPLVVLQILYHLTDRDGVYSPETTFIFCR